MTAINNHSLRIYTIKIKSDGKTLNPTVKVDLMPGLNSVKDEDWAAVKDTAYAKRLQDVGEITVAKSIGEAAPEHDKIDKESASKLKKK